MIIKWLLDFLLSPFGKVGPIYKKSVRVGMYFTKLVRFFGDYFLFLPNESL